MEIKKETDFERITITLETKEELEFFYQIGNCSPVDMGEVFNTHRSKRCLNWREIKNELHQGLKI